MGRLSNPLPSASEETDVRNDADHALLAPVHGLGFDVAEPDAKVRVEVFAGELEPGRLAATVQLKIKDLKIEAKIVHIAATGVVDRYR